MPDDHDVKRERKPRPSHHEPLTDDQIEAALAVLRAEFQSNPGLAHRLLAALTAHTQDNPPSQSSEKKSAARSSASTTAPKDEGAFHAVVVLREEGAGLLRGRLERLGSKAALKAVAKRSGLRLTGAASKRTATMADLVDGILRAAEHYDAQRAAAAK